MIKIKYNDSDNYIVVNFKRLSDNVVRIKGEGLTSNTSGFKTFSIGLTPYGDFSDYITVYNQFEDEIQYSNDGSVFEEEKEEYNPDITLETIKQILIGSVQNYMDYVASTRGYDGILSVCSYFDSGVERFDEEGRKARLWRSAVWEYCYAQLDLFEAGKLDHIPSEEELINSLPKMDW